MAKVMGKIEACQTHLKRWSKKSICNISRTLVEKRKVLRKVEEAAVKGGHMDFFFQLKIKVNDFLRLEEKCGSNSRHLILYLLQLEPPFPNNDDT